VTQPADSGEQAQLDKRSERIRRRFLDDPAFLDMVRRSQEDERAGRLISHEELVRKHEIAD
jgi:hypothetical protein